MKFAGLRCFISCFFHQSHSSMYTKNIWLTLPQVMAWCLTAPSHNLSQCWWRYMSSYGFTRPQWVKFRWHWLDLFIQFQSEPFQSPVDLSLNPAYPDYIVNPMDLSVLEENRKQKNYGSTEAFLADAKWIHHNSIVFNGGKWFIKYETCAWICMLCVWESYRWLGAGLRGDHC